MADLGSFLGAAGVGSAIGQAVVQLELSTAKYQAELKAAEGKTAASTSTMGSSFSKFSSIASTAFLAIGVAAVAGLAASVKAAIEANAAHLKLQNTFENNANLADSSVAAFEAQAEAIRALTGVDDEAIISGQALLGTMGTTGEQVQELTPLIVDLASKYDIDLQAAFKAVGRATQGSTGALSRYIGAIEAGTTPAENFTNVMEKLGGVQGFAAERAKAEPWRLLSSAMEEIAETIGQQLLPAIQSLAQTIADNIGVVEKLGDSIVALIDIYKDLAQISFAPWTVPGDAMSELGGKIDEVVAKSPDLQKFLEESGNGLQDVGKAAKGARQDVTKFAHMTGEDLEKWATETKESFESYVINLDKVQEETDFTKKDLRDSFRAMLQHARDLNQAMRTLSREHWINDEFVAFLAEQPDKLILFANSNETAQRKMQEQWKTSGDILKNQINDRLDTITGVLDHLDRGDTKHKVTIEYEYVGFDPSKPGMSNQQK